MIIEREFDVSIKKISIKNFKNIEEGEQGIDQGRLNFWASSDKTGQERLASLSH